MHRRSWLQPNRLGEVRRAAQQLPWQTRKGRGFFSIFSVWLPQGPLPLCSLTWVPPPSSAARNQKLPRQAVVVPPCGVV